jgi:hypothetical protein
MQTRRVLIYSVNIEEARRRQAATVDTRAPGAPLIFGTFTDGETVTIETEFPPPPAGRLSRVLRLFSRLRSMLGRKG